MLLNFFLNINIENDLELLLNICVKNYGEKKELNIKFPSPLLPRISPCSQRRRG
jgi:hypothetical protein